MDSSSSDRDGADEPVDTTYPALAGDGVPTPRVFPGLISSDQLDQDAVRVLRRLARFDHDAYLVGGGVRDLLLGKEPKDFDVATSARPNEVKRLFRNCRLIGRRFRLAHILFAGGKIIETATFRRDPSATGPVESLEAVGADGETVLSPTPKDRDDDTDLLIRQDNVFGLPHEDAIRRDFTINGLFYDLARQEVIDYVGGVADLEGRVLRTIGEPDVRFREDPVRILRAIKFSARLDLGIAPEVYDAMVGQCDELSRSAPPRVFEEILRLLRGGAAQRSIYLAWDMGVLGVILPELTAFLEDEAEDADALWGRLRAVDLMHSEGRLPSDTVLLGALLYGPMQEAVVSSSNPGGAFEEFFDDMTARLPIPRRTRDRLRLVFAAQRRLDSGRTSGMRRREFFLDALALYECRLRAEGQDVPDWVLEGGADDLPRDPRPRRRQRSTSRSS